jgi:hypothetical protein
MDEQQRKDRELEALELMAAELEKIRMLMEFKIGAWVEDREGTLYVTNMEK